MADDSIIKKTRKPKGPVQTVDEPVRNMYPGIYDDPRTIVANAASRVAKESPAMKRLFGVTRQELYDASANRKGSADPLIATKDKARGSIAASRLMNPRNAQRLQDILFEAGKHHGLQTGMDAWYNMDPVLERLKQLVGPDEAPAHYSRLNTIIGMMSPGSEVNTEIDRGLAAHHLFHQGKIDQFIEKGGQPLGNRDADFPQEIARMKGHPYHSTSQAFPLKKYLENGQITSDAPKVPLYVQASEAHQTGNQTSLPVPDAHFTRALGMADTRGGASAPGASMKMAEFQPAGPWFRDKVAKPLGLEAVPAQARLWGAASGQTGVTTKIGAPKLELLSNHIMAVARHHKIEPETARDLVLTGKIYFRGGVVSKAMKLTAGK